MPLSSMFSLCEYRFKSLFLIVTILILINRSNGQDSIVSGSPNIGNCMPDLKTAAEQYFLIKNGFSLTILWSTEGHTSDSPIDCFTYTYDVLRWSDREDPTKSPGQTFSFQKFMKNDGKVVRFPPFTATPGIYRVELKPKYNRNTCNVEFAGRDSENICYLVVKTLPPIIVLDEGIYRQVPERTAVLFNAGNSINLDKPLDNNNINTMKFSWKCTQKSPETFCGNGRVLSSSNSLTIPAEKVLKDQVFDVTVTVTTTFNEKDSATQKVEVVPNAAVLKIRCKKNCPPVTDAPNIQSITFLEVVCEYNCQDVREEHYEWEIKPKDGASAFNFDYRKDTHYGRQGYKFVISKNVLMPATEYLITVNIKNSIPRPGKTTIAVKYAVLPKVDKCVTVPPTGSSLHTWFTLYCEEAPPPDRNNFYEVFLDDKLQERVVSGYYPDVFRTRLLLPPSKGRKFIVKVSKGSGPAIFLDLNAQVTSASDNKTSSDILHMYKDFISKHGTSKLLSSKNKEDQEKGALLFQALVDELVSNELVTDETHEFARNVTYTVMQDLLRAPPKSVDLLVTMADSITKLIEHNELSKSDPLLANIASSVCRLMITTHAEDIKHQKFPLNSEMQFTTVGSVLTKCLEANIKENFDLLRPVKYNITIDEVPSHLLEHALLEDYPNYVDFGEKYGEHMENLQKLTENILNATAVAAKALALTTAVGEHFAKTSGKYSATLVAKDKGTALAKTRIQLLDTVLIPSDDFVTNTHPFDILLSSWAKDFMWWNSAKTRISTNILSVQFWHSSCKKRIRHFKSPVSLLMDVKNTSSFQVQLMPCMVSSPKSYSTMPDKELNRYIQVYRIAVPRHSALHIDFHNIPESNMFDVVTTNFVFPSIENFRHNKSVTNKTDSHIRVFNPDHLDIWSYLAILPSRRANAKNTSPVARFNVSFILTFCVRWINLKGIWEIDCESGLLSSPDVIHCECSHFSVIAGYRQNAIPMLQNLITVDMLLELQATYIIFTTLAATVTIYCALMICIAFRRQPEVFYLADNQKLHRYAYLVTVRTDNKHNAGTTSNVVIRLTGTKKSSEPHVLNYPDPKMRLLQKEGEDMFVLTTEHHLGPMVRIELWYDCSGPSPSWYCRDVVVFDLQQNVQWYFKIKTLFSVHGGVTYLITAPTEEEPSGSIFNKFRLCNHFHTWQLWTGEKNFTFFDRLTVVFSNVLMIYVFVLIMVGLPALELNDCLDVYKEFDLTRSSVVRALFASFMSFVIHILVAWAFRFSNIEFSAFNKKFVQKHNSSVACWLMLTILIMLSTSFLLVYGFWVPKNSSLVWLACCLIAIIFEIIVLENMFIFVQTLICKFKLTLALDNKIDLYLQMIETQRLVLHRKFDAMLLRPYISHLYRPLKAMQITRRRIVVELRRGIYNDLEDLVMYGVYNIILYMLILLNKGRLTTVSRDEIESMVEGQHTRTLAFSKISSTGRIYEYLNETLIPTMQPNWWYENYPITAPGTMIDNANKFIGVVRMRQLRMKTDVCVVPQLMKFLNMSCWPEFSMPYAESRSFGPGWSKLKPSAEYDRLKSIWVYQSVQETKSMGGIGHISKYSGGGYVAFLGRTLYSSYLNLLNLAKFFWIDRRTRGLFIEFMIYNVNYNIFIAVSLLFEQSATGYTSSTIEINVIRMVAVENEIELMAKIFFVLFIGWVCLLMLKLSVGIFKHITTFYKRVWLMIDLIINVMSIITITLYTIRVKMVGSYLVELEEVKHNEFVSHFSLLYVERFLMYFAGILICIATARLWKFLRFGLFFRIMERTLSMGAFPLLAVTFAFSVILTAFGLSGVLLYGNEFPELSDFVKIVATLIQLSLKPDQFNLSNYLDISVSYYYFALYLLLMQVILLLYVTVIIMAYMKAQVEFSVLPDSYTVTDYLQERIDYVPRLIKTKFDRLRGGEAESEKNVVSAKADEFRYANCITIPRKRNQSMKFIVSCIVRNMNQSSLEQQVLTEHEIELMLGVCKSFVLKRSEDDSMELFYKGHFEGEKIRLIDEKQIIKIADFVQLMFRQKGTEEEIPIVKPDPNIVRCSKMVRQKNTKLQSFNVQLKLLVSKLNDIEESLTHVLQNI